MSDRKPFALPVASWVDQQIQQAQRRGDFDALPGSGKPLPKVDTTDPAWWLKQKLVEENLELPLPPSLELKRDVRRRLAALALLKDEARVREGLALLNAQICKANRTSISGPPTDMAPVAIEPWMDRWRAQRSG